MPTEAEIEKWQARLTQAEDALHELLTGAQVVRVEYDGDMQEYTRTTEDRLRAYIRELQGKLGLVRKRPRSRRVSF
ncbi:gpW family head-tail joining protein [uncultured Sulfitobacter sp.]|uniref:gpW family head-tail joining protein n=1 Tax=uncultured Sulfitobacter sp. TaxID=191468 RepID=UPI0026393466|nr:gpW family head-tail joining protein [uncultured Sulfitobacter sp.]